jgi:hypothetical protein
VPFFLAGFPYDILSTSSMVGRQHFWRVSKLRLVKNNIDAVALHLGLALPIDSISLLVVAGTRSAKEDGF